MKDIETIKKAILSFLTKQRPNLVAELGDAVLSLPISEFGFDSLDELTLTLDIEEASGASFTTENLSEHTSMNSILTFFDSSQ